MVPREQAMSAMSSQIVEQLLDCLPTFTADEQAVALAAYRELALGEPVSTARLASATGRPEADVREILERPHLKSLTYSDDTGIVGFGGLAVRKMHHRFTVDGRQLYTWCAWDSLFIPPILDRPAEVASPCPTTGETVRVVLSPKGVQSIEPETAVMSFLMPDASAFGGDVQQTMSSFCHFVYFFASPDAAAPWIDNHPGTVVMSIADGFRLGALMNETRWGIVRTAR